jgi:hypothetical protein
MFRSLIQGLWLGLAGDLTNGTFYRPVVSELGYGGTRYFPLHFVALAAVWKLGAGPEWAAIIVQSAAFAILATGLYAAARRLGVASSIAALASTAGTVSYFIQQSLHELRCDILATGLNVWGLAMVLPIVTAPEQRSSLFSKGAVDGSRKAAIFFTLAMATKVTSLAVPAFVVAGLFWSGRHGAALRLLRDVAIGVVLVLSGIWVLSMGRALENWQAAMFAGVGAEGTLDLILSGTFVERISYSRYLRVLVAVTGVALAATAWLRIPWRTDSPLRLIGSVFAGVTVATCITLSSPGTMPSNQAVEWIAVAVLLVTCAGAAAPSLSRYAGVVLSLLALWAAAQNVDQVRRFFGAATVDERPAERAAVLERTRTTKGLVFSESALWPVLTNRHPVLLDAFMLRILTETRPDILRDLSARFDRREFALVILQRNPEIPRGRQWFEDVALGWPLVERILANYRFDRQLAPDAFVYVPR